MADTAICSHYQKKKGAEILREVLKALPFQTLKQLL